MNHPLSSIVLCTYNGEKFLEQQIDSLLGQTYPHIEIIISDDASTDNTRDILKQYASDHRIKLYLQEKNTGSIRNFEFALSKTTGDFICFSDQDDIWMENKIEKLLAGIKDNYLIYGNSILVDESGKLLSKKLSDLRNMRLRGHTKGFIFSNVVWGHTMMISRKFIPHVLPIPTGIPHDIWMGYNAAVAGSICYCETPLTFYRQHANTVTITIAAKPVSRSAQKRYADFEKTLHWIAIMKEHATPTEKNFYEQIHELYSQKKNENYCWSLWYFLMKHRQELFVFKRKKWISQVVEIFKQARGERI